MSSNQPIGAVQASAYATNVDSVRELGPNSKLKKANAPEQFEAFVLQSFIEEMLPKSSESVFGSGIAGDYWRSMLAEQVAGQVAKHGGIGVADMIRGGDRPGLKGALSSIPQPQLTVPSASTSSEAADILASGPPVSLSDILGD